MPGIVTAVFGSACDFEEAMQAHGFCSLLPKPGQFRARLTQIGLTCLTLLSGEESVGRVAFIAVPTDSFLLAIPERTTMVWGGTHPSSHQLLTIGPGQRIHARTDGPGTWNLICCRMDAFNQCSSALIGTSLSVAPFVRLWRPPAQDLRRLRELHASAIRAARSSGDMLTQAEVRHGLEQQLIELVIRCMGPAQTGYAACGDDPGRACVLRLEALLAKGELRTARAIREALTVPDRLLRAACARHLGMPLSQYITSRSLRAAHRTLCRAAPASLSVAEAARSHGFRHLGRFAAAYQAFFGEKPSATLRRQIGDLPELTRKRRTPVAASGRA